MCGYRLCWRSYRSHVTLHAKSNAIQRALFSPSSCKCVESFGRRDAPCVTLDISFLSIYEAIIDETEYSQFGIDTVCSRPLISLIPFLRRHLIVSWIRDVNELEAAQKTSGEFTAQLVWLWFLVPFSCEDAHNHIYITNRNTEINISGDSSREVMNERELSPDINFQRFCFGSPNSFNLVHACVCLFMPPVSIQMAVAFHIRSSSYLREAEETKSFLPVLFRKSNRHFQSLIMAKCVLSN